MMMELVLIAVVIRIIAALSSWTGMLICVMLKLKGSDGSILKEIWDREKPYSTTL